MEQQTFYQAFCDYFGMGILMTKKNLGWWILYRFRTQASGYVCMGLEGRPALRSTP